MAKNIRVARVLKREEVTNDLFKLWLVPEDGASFNFNPGQYCTIGFYDENGEVALDRDGKKLLRPYSIVSAPHEKEIELFVELVPPPDGNLTPLLHEVKIGESVPLMPKAKGVFTFEPEHKNHVMVATVTGIAPFVSIIRDYIHRQMSGHNFYILQGASYMEEFGYEKEMDMMSFESVERHFISGGGYIYSIPTISRPREPRNAAWNAQTGRANAILEECLEYWELLASNTLIYACGHPGMVEDVEQRFGPEGKSFKVKTEMYWS